MKILQLCNRVPFPPSDGGSIAMFNMASSLEDCGHEVKILCCNTNKHFVDINSLSEDVVLKYKIEAVNMDTSVRIVPAIFSLIKGTSYHIERFNSDSFRKKLISVLEKDQYHIVQLE